MKLSVRVSWDKKPDLTELVDEIHETFGDALLDGARESTPVDSGRTKTSWSQKRTDEHITTISNTRGDILALLHEGTKPHKVGMFTWKAAKGEYGGGLVAPGLKVHIDKDRIALRATHNWDGDGLPAMMGGNYRPYWFYSYHKDLTEAILNGTELAVRKMNAEQR